MPASPVRIGPFVGGMNTYSGPSAIADNEAVELLNVDIDLDGAIKSRPPVETFSPPISNQASHVIGIYRSITDVVYIIYAFDSNVYAFDTSSQTWVSIVAATATACVQYNDKLYIVLKPSGTTQGGGKWDPTGGYVAIAAMPRGFDACIYKERMFISASRNGDETSINRVKFSNPANPEAWTGTDTFDVAAGDGQDIMALFVYDSQIVVFKTDSTYVFAYETSPSKGLVQIVSSTIGANNKHSVVEYENNLFVMHESNVYRISNWNWEHANIKVPFTYSNIHSVGLEFASSISILGNRLFCRYYDKYYTIGLKTGAWTVWEFDGYTISEFVTSPTVDVTTGKAMSYAGSYENTTLYLYKFNDVVSTVLNETFTARLVTKSYDFGPSYSFKRLFWWGVDILSKSTVNYKVTPTVYNSAVTWNQLLGVQFNDLQTWGRPLEVSLDVTDSASGSNPSNYRTFIKLLKSLRFRQISFTIESIVDGTDSTGPLRVFSLTAFIDAKELVTKKVS